MYDNKIKELAEQIASADGIVIGAGSGLSESAGMTYSGNRFEEHFPDFIEKYHFPDMYMGGFYSFATLEEWWAYWSRYIYINRYHDTPKPTYHDLYDLVKDREYFVLTTNVDHCFQKAGFDRHRLFYTQGDYGLLQCSKPCHHKTYDNEELVRRMVKEQVNMRVPTELIPHCPVCGRPMTMNLRCDDTFVQDEGWQRAGRRYEEFLREHDDLHILFLELGVGGNTPRIIKYPFWQMTYSNSKAIYACINLDSAFAPAEIAERSICIQGDIGMTLAAVKKAEGTEKDKYKEKEEEKEAGEK